MYFHSEEVKAKLREAWKRRRLIPVSADTRAKQSAAHKGKPKSEEWRRKIGEANKGKNIGKSHPHTDESKRKIGLANKGKQPWLGRKHTDEWKAKRSAQTQGQNAPGWKDGRMSDPGYVRLYGRLDRQKRRAIGGISASQWAAIKAKFHDTCPACGKAEPDIKLTIDHIIPVARGGTNETVNLQPLCGACNSRKHTSIKRYDVPSGLNQQIG